MGDSTWRVRAVLDYEIEASCELEAIDRLNNCVIHDLKDSGDIRTIADIKAEKISDTGIED